MSYGSLAYEPLEGVSARLLDSPLGDRDQDEPPEIDVLLGETLGGAPFSLIGTWITNTQILHGPRAGSAVDLRAGTLVRGIHVSALEDLSVSRAHCDVSGLLEFLTGGKVDQRFLQVRPERDLHVVRTFPLESGDLTLGVVAQETRGRHRHLINLAAGGSLGFDQPIAYTAADEAFVGPLCDLISFSTQIPAELEKLEITPPMESDDTSDWGPPSIEIFTRMLTERPLESAYNYYALSLNLATVPDPEAIVAGWFRLRAELGPVWPFLFGTINHPELPLENQLLNLTAFAEGYHRTFHDKPPLSEEEHQAMSETMLDALPSGRHRRLYRAPLVFANSQTQRERIRWLTERALAVADGWDLDAKSFTDQLVDTRNWLVHWGRRGPATQEGRGQALLRIRLEHVLRINLLLELGLSEDDAAKQFASGMRLRHFV